MKLNMDIPDAYVKTTPIDQTSPLTLQTINMKTYLLLEYVAIEYSNVRDE
jgi:hypothetical protein